MGDHVKLSSFKEEADETYRLPLLYIVEFGVRIPYPCAPKAMWLRTGSVARYAFFDVDSALLKRSFRYTGLPLNQVENPPPDNLFLLFHVKPLRRNPDAV